MTALLNARHTCTSADCSSALLQKQVHVFDLHVHVHTYTCIGYMYMYILHVHVLGTPVSTAAMVVNVTTVCNCN